MSGEGEYPFSHRRNAKIFNSTGVPLQSKKKVGPGQRPGFPLVSNIICRCQPFWDIFRDIHNEISEKLSFKVLELSFLEV